MRDSAQPPLPVLEAIHSDGPNSPLPFLKWAGGKQRVVRHLREYFQLPARRFVEPFAGSASVSLALHDQAETFWLNDVNPDLVHLYRCVIRSPERLTRTISEYFTPKNNSAKAFYRFRRAFNEARVGTIVRAALFVYLNRHGFNGLCRFNAKKEFNVPFGRYASVMSPVERILRSRPLLRKSEVTQLDFEDVLDDCAAGDVVYCDPPYVPLSATANFTDYSVGGFSTADHERLADAARRATRRGAVVVISNHDLAETRTLYRGAKFTSISVKRHISARAETRGEAAELIAVFSP